MLVTVLLILVGFVVLGVGAEFMVNGSSKLALRLGITPLVVGLTVVAFGTSAPELAVSIESTLDGVGALALGNVIGSNIANIGLVLGITAIIHPIEIERNLVRSQIPIVIGCTVLLGLLLLDGQLGTLDGLLLGGGLLVFLGFSYWQSTREMSGDDPDLAPIVHPREHGRTWVNVLMLIGGLVLLVAGSSLFVSNTVDLARTIGISEAVIGLTLVAIGTSVPELATSVTAAFRRQGDIAIGNVIGSNTFNILSVLGITALFGVITTEQFSRVDFIVMLAFAVLLLPLARSGWCIRRREGILLIVAYCCYLSYLAVSAA